MTPPVLHATGKLGMVVARLAKDYDAVHIKTQEIIDSAAKWAENPVAG